MSALTVRRTSTDAAPLDGVRDFGATSLSGQVKVVRGNGDGFFVIDLHDGTAKGAKVVGEFSENEIIPFVSYQFFGTWAKHDRYGDQFRAEAAVLATQTEPGMISFLTRSGLGLSNAEAKRLWRAYGISTVHYLRTDPDRISADGHLSPDKARQASGMLDQLGSDEKTVAELHEIFAGRGIPRGAIRDCIREWGASAPAVIRRDPFKLLTRDIEGIGFKRADQLYLDLGGNPLRLKRQTLGAWHHLTRSGTGNTWEAIGTVNAAIVKAAGGIMGARLAEAITLGVRARWLSRRADAAGVELVAHRGAAESETRLAQHVRRILAYPPRWPPLDGLPVSAHQLDAIRPLAASPFFLLGGTPGTGKTYVAAALLKRLVEQLGPGALCVCAPTGKAAVRITDALSRYGLPLAAKTIHATLGPAGTDSFGRWRFQFGEEKPLGAAIYVVDEASMIDADLAASFLAAVPPGANVLLVGDVNQLPPVGHGAPLRDLLAADVPSATLTELQRNSGAIVSACAEIRDGRMFTAPTTTDVEAGLNLRLLEISDAPTQLATVLDILRRCRPTLGLDPVWDTQVLVGTNERGELSRIALNRRLQALLNPAEDGATGGIRTGDKVICLKNRPGVQLCTMPDPASANPIDYRPTGTATYLSNGDQGRVYAADRQFVVVRFTGPDRLVRLPRAKKSEGASAHDLDFSYALTVHKSQGSEYPFVIVCLDGTGGVGCREWIYTAISRAKKLCFLIGPRTSAATMIARREITRRRTHLVELLKEKAI